MSTTTDELLYNFLLSTGSTYSLWSDAVSAYIISLAVLVLLLITFKLFLYKLIST